MTTAAPWRRRRLLAALVRAGASFVPLAASFAVGIGGHVVVPTPAGTVAMAGRWLGILVASLVVLTVTDRFARRFLPLATLLHLSLAFPDQTPSRFRLALRQGSGRRLARATADARRHGLSDEPAVAAEQLVLLAAAIGDHDRRTRGHSERVRLFAEVIGEELGLDADERNKLQWAALIHDIGKVSVPAEILNKKGRPDEREWAILQGHPLAGEQMVSQASAWLGEWVHAVGGHHERWDGSGYPRGIAGVEISRAAAIVSVADAFEVMTAVRSYKKAMSLTDARRELTRCAGTHFSPDVVRALLNVSIGRLRRSMGIVAAIAHVPFFGRVTTAAAYAPDTVSAAVGLTTSAATAGAGAVAVTAAIAVTGPTLAAASPASVPPPVAVAAPAPVEVATPTTSTSVAPPAEVAVAAAAPVVGEVPEVAPPAFVAAEAEPVAVVAPAEPVVAPPSVPAPLPVAPAAVAPAQVEVEAEVEAEAEVEVEAEAPPERAPGPKLDRGPDHVPGPPADHVPGPPDHAVGPPVGHDPGPPADHQPGPPADRQPGPPADREPGPPAGRGGGRR